MGSRGCLPQLTHLILDLSNNQFPFCSKFGIIIIFDPSVVQRREVSVVWCVVWCVLRLWCVECGEFGEFGECGTASGERTQVTK